jgi:hypothetical protein
MIETSYFTCPNKGKMLAIYFDDKNEMNYEFLKQFSNSDLIDRYIELIFRCDGKEIIETLIKQELTNKAVVDDVISNLFINKSKLKTIFYAIKKRFIKESDFC